MKNWESKSLISVTRAGGKNISLTEFKPESTEARKLLLKVNISTTRISGALRAWFTKWLLTNFCLSRTKRKENIKKMMTNLDFFKRLWVKYLNNLHFQVKDLENSLIKMHNLSKSKKLMKYLSIRDLLNTKSLKKMLMKSKISYSLCLNLTLKKEFLLENALKILGSGIEKKPKN